ncbi:acyl-CoA mutase large subunit family protein [bacterium]|nr:acyl-CoA mutase large subunit family protein [bacterium]
MVDTNQSAAEPKRLLSEFEAPTLEQWHEEVVRLLKGAPFEKKMLTPTYEGITLKPIYTQEDVEGLEHVKALPGDPPYVRGTDPIHYRTHGWEIAQELPYPTYEEFNAALKHDMARGQSAVNLLLDEATQAGLDPDYAQQGQVGKDGTSISSVIGLGRALDGLDLSETPIYIQAGSAALPFAALLIALMRRNGQDVSKLRGSIGFDPLAGLATHGSLPISLERAWAEIALLTRWARSHAPQVKTISIWSHMWHEAGANAVQELAIALATGVCYLREMEQRGLSVEETAGKMQFGFSIGGHFFMEIAKLRAARLLWAKVVQASGGSPDAGKMTIHGRTSRRQQTTFDPYTNILRSTTQAFSAVVGGVDSLHVAPFDEALGVPGEFGRRIARNTHIILRDEAHLNNVLDPAGGSWYVETLTDQLSQEAWKLFQQIEAEGGIEKALEKGFLQEMVEATAQERHANLATRKDVQVGINMYPNLAERPVDAIIPDLEKVFEDRTKRLQALRVSSEHGKEVQVLFKLGAIMEADPEDVFEAVIDAAAHGATIGEFTKTLRHGDGTKPTARQLIAKRVSEDFENLRRRVLAAQDERKPSVFLANVGPVAGYMPRVDFTRSFFQVGGFRVAGDDWFEDAEAAVEAAKASRASVVVIVSTDDQYEEIVPTIAGSLKQQAKIILAGYPKEQIESFTAAGVESFIHMRSDVYAVLNELADNLEGK